MISRIISIILLMSVPPVLVYLYLECDGCSVTLFFVDFQRRQGHSNPKSSSEKYNPEEDGGSGFPLGPSKGLLQNGGVHGRLGQPVNMNGNGVELMGWRAYNKSAVHGGSSRFDHLGRETNNAHMQWPEEHSNDNYNPLTDAESSHSLLDRAKFTYKQNGHTPGKESLMVYTFLSLSRARACYDFYPHSSKMGQPTHITKGTYIEICIYVV